MNSMYEDLAVAVVNDIREGTFAYLPFDRPCAASMCYGKPHDQSSPALVCQ